MDTKKLRQKILDLAIRGKLVPQDPNDEPASVLLGRIREEKKQMVKDGRLKAKDVKNDTIIFKGEDNLHYEKFQDGTVKCIKDEIPFDVPDGWEWCRIRDIMAFKGGYAYKSNKYIDNSHNYIIRIGNVKNNSINPYIAQTCISDDYAKETESYKLQIDDILFTMTGTKGRRDYFFSAIVDKRTINGINIFLNQRVGCLRNYCPEIILSHFILICLQASFTLNAIFSTETGNVNQGNIGSTATLNLLVPIPPTEEQKRIYQKVFDIIHLFDIYKSDSKDLRDLVDAAKNKILDLAIRGKLVPQNPDDEPASVLLERISAEKEELIKQGKLKRDKKESIIYKGDDNSYYLQTNSHSEKIEKHFMFDLPNGWTWCVLQNVARSELGKTLDQVKNTGRLHPYLRSVNIKWDDVDLSDLNQMRFEDEEIERYTVKKGDLLICEGGDVGRSAIWNSNGNILYQNALHRVRFRLGINPRFFMYYLMYYESKGILKEICKGVTIKHLTGNVLNSIPFALPPLNEQNRIVDMIDDSFKIINELL